MTKQQYRIAAIPLLWLASVSPSAAETYEVFRYSLHVPQGHAFDLSAYQRLLGQARTASAMRGDVTLLGGFELDAGVSNTVDMQDGKATVVYPGGYLGYVKSVGVPKGMALPEPVKARLGESAYVKGVVPSSEKVTPEVVPGSVEDRDTLTLDTADASSVGYHLVSNEVTGFDTHTASGPDGSIQRTQRPHQDDVDLSGRLALPSGLATVVVMPYPGDSSGSNIKIYVVHRKS